MPAEEDSWEFPGVVSALGIDYMMHTMYPDLLNDEELEGKVNPDMFGYIHIFEDRKKEILEQEYGIIITTIREESFGKSIN